MSALVVLLLFLFATTCTATADAPGGRAALDANTRLAEVEEQLEQARLEVSKLRTAANADGQHTEKLRNAFSQLLAEKRQLAKAVRDEHTQLVALQRRINNPSLGLWLGQRGARLLSAAARDVPEAEALAYYARLYVKPGMGRATQRLAALERHVQRGVDTVLPARVSTWVAVLLTALLVGVPLLLAGRLAFSLSRSLSLAQYVLLANVFLTALACGLILARIALGQDPLDTLHEGAEQLFICTQLALAVAFPVFLGLLGATAWGAWRRKSGTAYMFLCQIIFYTLIALNYRRRVWQPAMMGEVLHASPTMYLVYLIDFACMTGLTVGAARATGAHRDRFLPTSHAAARKRIN